MAQGEGTEARRVFTDVAHQPLHELASELQEGDTALAGRLLRAKQRVEAQLETGPADLAALASALDQLADVTRAALGVAPCER